MALKYKYGKREEIPAEQAALYVEREGAFYLDAEGATDKAKVDELRNHNIELRRKLEDFTSRFEGIDPEAALIENDSLAVFLAAGGGVETGPTGTNVNDLYIALRLDSDRKRDLAEGS